MTFDDYIGKPLVGSSGEIDSDLFDTIDDDGDAISITFGTEEYDEDDDNDWIVETGCIIYCDDDHKIEGVEPTAKIMGAGDSGLGELDPDDWVDEEKIQRILNELTGSEPVTPETWRCSCWVVYEDCTFTDDVDLEIPCTIEEYTVLSKLEFLQQRFDFDPDNEEMVEEAIEDSHGLFEDQDDILEYYDKHVDDCPELFDFIDKVTDAGYEIFEEECEDYEDHPGGTLGWNYGSVL